MQNDEHNKEKVAPQSSLGRLENYLRPGESINVRIVMPLGEPVAGQPRNWQRFQVAQLVPGMEKYPFNDPDEVEDLTPDTWFEGNTIAACLLQLVAHLDNERPMTESEAQAVAYLLSKGKTINSLQREKFTKYLEGLKVERI